MRHEQVLRDLENEMAVLVRRIRWVLAERGGMVHPELQSFGYSILNYLRSQGPQRAATIAETFLIDKGAVSRQVQHLLDLELVERRPDPRDGRASLLDLTDEARARLDDVDRSRRERLSERLGDWDEPDLEEFVAALGRYNRSLS